MRDFLIKTWRLLLDEKKRAEFVTIVIRVFVLVLGVFGAVWLVFVYLYPSQPVATNPKHPSVNIEDSKLEKSPVVTGDHNKVEIGK